MADAKRRAQGRAPDELRPLRIETDVNIYAEGSCLISMGNTRVLCTASAQEGVPHWRRGSGEGWVTAEYSMLPRATMERTQRERERVGGRTQEIQRLIGRSLRACIDMRALGDWTIRVDCDVLQADGGTRTASVTGGAVALARACDWLVRTKRIKRSPFRQLVAAVSAGIVEGETLLDLDYFEDSRADADVNVVALESGGLIEIQGTGEKAPFSPEQLAGIVELTRGAIDRLVAAQREVIAG